MEQRKVDLFILNNGPMFPEKLLPFIREEILKLDDEKWQVISTLQFKSPMIALLLSIGCGTYGVDRFYLGDTILGIFKLSLTLILITAIIVQSIYNMESWPLLIFMFAIIPIIIFWYLIDIILVVKATKELNYNSLLTILH